jgi:predicted O-methyltransferase YrrM
MKKFIRSKLDAYFAPFARKSDIDNLYAQLAALIEIKGLTGPQASIGPLRGWALSPDALVTVLREVVRRDAPQIVEFGASESTLALAATLKNGGSGSLTTIEHDADFAGKIQNRLRDYGLSDRVNFLTLPMREYESHRGLSKFMSYDLSRLDLDFDVALIDGPIAGQFGVHTRVVPLEWCAARLKSGGVVFLDDTSRPGETEIIGIVKKLQKRLATEFLDTEKGLCRLTVTGE